MSLQVTKVSVHRYFDAVPRLAGHKGICSITLNHHFAINNILVTRPKRQPGDDEKPELTVKYPVLRNFVKNREGGYDIYQRHVVTVAAETLHREIEDKVLETFNQGYLDAVPYLKDGVPIPRESLPVYTTTQHNLPVPEITNVRFYKYIPARAEAPTCRFDTYVFSFSMEGIEVCEARLVVRPQGTYVAVPAQRKYESMTGEIINKDRTNSIVAPISHSCRAALEKAASKAFVEYCENGMVWDDDSHLPAEVIFQAGRRRMRKG